MKKEFIKEQTEKLLAAIEELEIEPYAISIWGNTVKLQGCFSQQAVLNCNKAGYTMELADHGYVEGCKEDIEIVLTE